MFLNWKVYTPFNICQTDMQLYAMASGQRVHLLLVLFCIGFVTCEGSDEMWWNHEFVFAIPDMGNNGRHPPAVYITTSTTQNLSTVLEYPLTGYDVSSNVSRSSPATIVLELGGNVGISDTRIGAHDGPQNKTIIIRSNGPISVHAIDTNYRDGDGFVVFSNSQLGTEYYVTSYTPWSLTRHTSFVCVSSIQPNTAVNIKTKAGRTRTVKLMQYESYRFDGEVGEDLSATLVQSDKPIAIISGVYAKIPSTTYYGDGIIEQLVPTNLWQSDFMLTPFLSLVQGYIYRIYSMNVETRINSISISDNITFQLEPESFYEGDVEEDKVLAISADNPVMVVCYTKSTWGISDSSMVFIPPVTSFSHGMVTFPTFELTDSHEYRINVVTDCGNVDGLFLDGMTDIRSWNRLTTVDQDTCCVRGGVTLGSHTVSHTVPTSSFYVLVYAISTECCSTYAYTGSTYYVEEYEWLPFNWEQCSVTCGSSVRTRAVWCVQTLANSSVLVDDESLCNELIKPAETETSELPTCELGTGTETTSNSPEQGCIPFEKPANGLLDPNQDVYQSGQSVTVYCGKGYDLIGDETLVCKDTGVWHGKIPKCTQENSENIIIISAIVGGVVLAAIVVTCIVVCCCKRKTSEENGSQNKGKIVRSDMDTRTASNGDDDKQQPNAAYERPYDSSRHATPLDNAGYLTLELSTINSPEHQYQGMYAHVS